MQDNRPRPTYSDYLDFEIEISPGTGREYPVAVLHSPAGEARFVMRFPFDELALDLRLGKLQIALLRSGGKHRRVPSQEEQAVQDFGQALFDSLFSGEVRSCYDVSLREATQQDRGLRLKLRIRPPELNALPWEFLYDPRQGEYVCMSRQTPLVRYLESPRSIRPFTVTPPLRILAMMASPHNFPPLDVEREKQRVEQAVQSLQARGLVELEWLPGQTWRDLQRATWGGPWHIFHFIGHGGFDAQTDEGFIALADSTGQADYLSATRLGRLLADHSALRLVLLNSCEGARGGERDIFSSTASILVRRGIPAVLAMQYEISDRAAVELARTFYEALACGMPVDEAVVVARKSISLAVNNTVEWGTPVLYMRTPDGVLFQVVDMAHGAPPRAEGLAPASQIDAGQERHLERFYLDGLYAFLAEEWEDAVRCFQSIVDQRTDYQDAAVRLREAKRQGDLARLYAQAQTAQESGDWSGALSTLEKLVAEAPDFRDAAASLEKVKKQTRLADLYAQAQQLHQAGCWHEVVNTFAQITALESDYPDPDGLLAAARREIEEERHQSELQDRYSQALHAMDSRRWAEVRQLLIWVQERQPGYRETTRLLARVEAEIEQENLARRRQEQVASLYKDAQGLVRDGRWWQALAKVEEIRTLDPQFADPDGIAAKAQATVSREEAEVQRQKELAALYAESLRLLRAGQYQAALDRWDAVQARDPLYPDRDKVQATARQKLARPARPASPKRDVPAAVRQKQTRLPAWFWPAVGAASVLLVSLIIVVAAWLDGSDGGTLAGAGTAADVGSTPTTLAARTATRTPRPEIAPAGINTPTDAPTNTPQPTALPTNTPTDTPEPTATPTTRPTATLQPLPTNTPKPKVPAAGATQTRSKDGMVMVYVPAGEFTMGSNEYDDEKPIHTVTLDAFWIDRTEVTAAQFRKCVEAGACQAPTTCDRGDPTYNDAAKADHPVVCVSWSQAKVYCEWAGVRLPTEAEWEKAARGTDERRYPWGNAFDGSKVNFCDQNCEYDYRDTSANDGYARTAPVGSYPTGASPYGVWDMAGNVWEWMADWYDSGFYNNSLPNNPQGPSSGNTRVLRGGSWSGPLIDVRAADRHHYDPAVRYGRVGLRCIGSSVP